MTAQATAHHETPVGVVARATAVAAGLTVLGALLGLLRDLMLARTFGASPETDAFMVAWTIPETASPLLIEGAMAYLMVPVFVRALAHRGALTHAVRETLPRLAWILAATAAGVAVAAPALVGLLAPGLAEPDLAVRSMRIAAVTVLTFGLAGYVAAALRADHVFGWPAAIYIAYNVGIIGSIVALHRPLGVISAAVGVAVGGVLMIAIQIPAFLRRLPPVAPAPASDLPRLAVLAFVPIAVFTLTRHAQVFVERILGSQLVAGTISHLNYAQKVAQVPMVLSVMVATVTFPMLARSIVAGDEEGGRRRMQRDLRLVAAVVLVASVYVIAFSEPIIRLLFERGAFTPSDTTATAAIMRVYALGLLGQAVVVVITRSYFSHRRSIWYPAVVMGAGLALTVLVGVLMLPVWGAAAIAAGNAAGITLTALLLLIGARRAEPAGPRPTERAIGPLLVMTAGAGGAAWLISTVAADLPTVAELVVGALVVLGVFVAVGLALNVDEARPLRDLLARAARRDTSPGPPFVLMYHSVDPSPDDPYRITVSPGRFAQHLRWLARLGLRGVAMRDLLAAADRGSTAGLVGLTFDDGYRDFLTYALPELRRHGFGATVFVVAGKMGEHNDWDGDGPRRSLMTAAQVRDLDRAGIEIGSHGLEHRPLSDVDAATMATEIRESRSVLRSLGVPLRGFCYPYGDLSDAAVHAVRDAGYDYAVATRRHGRPVRHALPRIYIGQRDGAARLAAKLLRHRLRWGARR